MALVWAERSAAYWAAHWAVYSAASMAEMMDPQWAARSVDVKVVPMVRHWVDLSAVVKAGRSAESWDCSRAETKA